MGTTKFPPTAEQIDAVEKFNTGKHMRVTAYAGAGKTSTMVLMAQQSNRRGLYSAFNKSIAMEAADKFAGLNVGCSTTHSLAFKAMTGRYSFPKLTGKANGAVLMQKGLAKSLDVVITRGQDRMPMQYRARKVGWIVAQTISRYCGSGRNNIEVAHIPREDSGIHLMAQADADAFAAEILKMANRAWDMMLDPRSDLPLGHDGYLKAWVLGRPDLGCDYFLLDEAQDTNGVVMALVMAQACQIISVGDAQQQIYEWRGAQNAMRLLPATHEARLSTSWRFGPEIAAFADRTLKVLGETVQLHGNPRIKSALCEVDKPRTLLCRNNANVLNALIAEVKKPGGKPSLVGGPSELLSVIDAIEKLKNGIPADRPIEFLGFNNWSEVEGFAEKPEGQDVARWVTMFRGMEPAEVRSCLTRLSSDEKASTMILSTAHKAKGREWSSVRLGDDFLKRCACEPAVDKNGARIRDAEGNLTDRPLTAGDDELRLFYVAATRAQEQLDVHPEVMEKLGKIEAYRAQRRANETVKQKDAA